MTAAPGRSSLIEISIFDTSRNFPIDEKSSLLLFVARVCRSVSRSMYVQVIGRLSLHSLRQIRRALCDSLCSMKECLLWSMDETVIVRARVVVVEISRQVLLQFNRSVIANRFYSEKESKNTILHRQSSARRSFAQTLEPQKSGSSLIGVTLVRRCACVTTRFVSSMRLTMSNAHGLKCQLVSVQFPNES